LQPGINEVEGLVEFASIEIEPCLVIQLLVRRSSLPMAAGKNQEKSQACRNYGQEVPLPMP